MFSKLTIGARLYLVFCIVLLFIVLIGGASYWGMGKMEFYINDLSNVDGALMDNSQRSRVNINIMRRYEKDLFLNIGDSAKMEDYKKKWDDTLELFNKRIDSSSKILASVNTPEHQKDKDKLREIKKQLDAYSAGFTVVYGKIKSGEITTPQDANKAIGEYKEATHKSETMVGELARQMDKNMESLVKESKDGSKKIKLSVAALAVTAIILALIQAFILIRSITTPLHSLVGVANTIAQGNLTAQLEVTTTDETGQLMSAMKTMTDNLRNVIGQVASTSNQVATASSQLTTAAEQIATGAEEVAAQSVTVATAGEEMAATSGDIAQNCQMAVEETKNASKASEEGQSIALRTTEGIKLRIQQTAINAERISILGKRSDQIGDIVGTIEDIADQTNLLALNAAIEAARAGEMGRGFAVVADEVRALAERTTKATKEISEMIKTIQQETKVAVDAMNHGVETSHSAVTDSQLLEDALKQIYERVDAVTTQVNQIATAAEEQTATTAEIANNMQQITQVVQSTAQGSHESATAAAQLHANAEELQRLVQRFRL